MQTTTMGGCGGWRSLFCSWFHQCADSIPCRDISIDTTLLGGEVTSITQNATDPLWSCPAGFDPAPTTLWTCSTNASGHRFASPSGDSQLCVARSCRSVAMVHVESVAGFVLQSAVEDLQTPVYSGVLVSDEELQKAALEFPATCDTTRGYLPRIRNGQSAPDVTIRWVCNAVRVTASPTNGEHATTGAAMTMSTTGLGLANTNTNDFALEWRNVSTFNLRPCWFAGTSAGTCPHGYDVTESGTVVLENIPTPTELVANVDGDLYIVAEVCIVLCFIFFFFFRRLCARAFAHGNGTVHVC